jgi:hypothetical protein
MSIFNEIINYVVLEFLGGNGVLDLLNEYFLFQSDVNKVLITIALLALSTLGVISLIKMILGIAKGILKIGLIIALIYYFATVFLPLDVIQNIING